MSNEERAWVNQSSSLSANGGTARSSMTMSSSSSSLSGQFIGSFRTFFNGGEQMQSQRQVNQYRSPPWEVGPEGLRLPRYSRVVRESQSPVAVSEANVDMNGSMSLKDLATKHEVTVDEEEAEEEDEDIVMSFDGCVASGSV